VYSTTFPSDSRLARIKSLTGFLHDTRTHSTAQQEAAMAHKKFLNEPLHFLPSRS
jgi:hypothetical protein